MSELITQTEETTFSRCEQRWDWRYNKWLVPFEESPALAMGSAVHAGIESRSVDAAIKVMRGPDPIWAMWEEDAARVREASVAAMVGGALARWSEWPALQEVQFELPLKNPRTGNSSKRHRFSGVFDGVWPGNHPDHPDEIVLGEWKTAAVVNRDYMQRLELDFQVSTYLWAASAIYGVPVRKVVYRVIKKPTIKQKKDESVEEYSERVTADYLDRPEHYFFEEIVERTDKQLEDWTWQAWAIHKRILQIKGGSLPPIRNTQSCISRGRCPYFDLCAGAITEDAYKKLPTKHREIKEVTNGNPSRQAVST